MVLDLSVPSEKHNSSLPAKNVKTSGNPDDFNAASDSCASKQKIKLSMEDKLMFLSPCCSVPMDIADIAASRIVFFISFIAALAR